MKQSPTQLLAKIAHRLTIPFDRLPADTLANETRKHQNMPHLRCLDLWLAKMLLTLGSAGANAQFLRVSAKISAFPI